MARIFFISAAPLLYIANVATAYQLGKAFSSAYGLRSAYERLSADNADTQAQLGEQLDSLLEAHREVQAFGRKLALFSEQAPIAVFEVDPQATILDMNPAAERMRSEFTSTLSHELRTPLTSIIGSLQLLRAGALGEVSKEQDEMVEIAEKNSQRLLDLINEVLDIEKIESGQLTLVPEPMPLDALLGESLRLNQGYADRFRANLALHGEVPQVVVRADRKRLMQVMTNLLSIAAERRRRRDCRAEGRGGARGGERPGAGHSRGLSRPHLRPLRAGRFGRFARQGRHRPGARHLQAAGGNDAGAHRLRGPGRRRHHVLFRAARHAARRDRRRSGPAGASHRARHRRRRVLLVGPRERRLARRRRARRKRLARPAQTMEVRRVAACPQAARRRGSARPDR